MTPLIWAARYGHEEVVRLLLREKDIRPDRPDEEYGRTALSWAAGNGHEGVVRLFLRPKFVNPRSGGRQWEKAAQAVSWVPCLEEDMSTPIDQANPGEHHYLGLPRMAMRE